MEYPDEVLTANKRGKADECLKAAKGAGLENVRVGNLHLLE
jgi:hypothetical protein